MRLIDLKLAIIPEEGTRTALVEFARLFPVLVETFDRLFFLLYLKLQLLHFRSVADDFGLRHIFGERLHMRFANEYFVFDFRDFAKRKLAFAFFRLWLDAPLRFLEILLRVLGRIALLVAWNAVRLSRDAGFGVADGVWAAPLFFDGAVFSSDERRDMLEFADVFVSGWILPGTNGTSSAFGRNGSAMRPRETI